MNNDTVKLLFGIKWNDIQYQLYDNIRGERIFINYPHGFNMSSVLSVIAIEYGLEERNIVVDSETFRSAGNILLCEKCNVRAKVYGDYIDIGKNGRIERFRTPEKEWETTSFETSNIGLIIMDNVSLKKMSYTCPNRNSHTKFIATCCELRTDVDEVQKTFKMFKDYAPGITNIYTIGYQLNKEK